LPLFDVGEDEAATAIWEARRLDRRLSGAQMVPGNP
jgi:hypothetical protein